MRQGVGTGVGHRGITRVLKTQFSTYFLIWRLFNVREGCLVGMKLKYTISLQSAYHCPVVYTATSTLRASAKGAFPLLREHTF